MRYDIRLTIEYRYPSASDHVRNILRLLPSNGKNQRVTQRILTISPLPDERRDSQDFFGNTVTQVAWHRPVDALTFTLRAEAERNAGDGLDLSPPLQALAVQIEGAGLGPSSPQHFRAASPRIGPSQAIADYTQANVPAASTAREAVKALGLALHRDMTFDPTATDVTTPPDQAFAARRGVCQDFAQIMIAGLRSLGIPAAYVSGFLRTTPPPGEPRLEGVDAMHGWISAWCGADQGWLEYDPTNGQWAGEDYVTAAWGRDYSEAAPVRGAIRTSGSQDTHHTVDVIPLN